MIGDEMKLAEISRLKMRENSSDTTEVLFDPYEKSRQKHELEKVDALATRAEKIVFAVAGIGLVCCFLCACFVYAAVIRPYQQSRILDSALRRRRTGGRGVTLPISVITTTTRRPRSRVGVSVWPTTE
jgi:hypothetical protein